MDLTETLERPIGPFPLWGWLAAGIVGVGIIVVMRRGARSGGGVVGTAGSGVATSGPPGAGAPDTAADLTEARWQDLLEQYTANLIDYGNVHWLGGGAPGGSGSSSSPITNPNPSPNPSPAAIAPVAAAPVAAAPVTVESTRAFTQSGYISDPFSDALNWFLRSDTSSGLASGWEEAPEDARQQLRTLISHGWVSPNPAYSGARPA